MKKSRFNLLELTGLIILIVSLYFIVVNIGVFFILLGISLLIFLLNRLLYNLTPSQKKYFAYPIWLTAIIFGFQTTKKITLHITGKPEKVYIITGEVNKPIIHSSFNWNNHIQVDTTNIVYTSSSISKLDNITIIDENGVDIGIFGRASSTLKCLPNSSLISLQTKYHNNNLSFNFSEKHNMLSDHQKNKCD